MFKKVIGIRTNSWSAIEESQYNKLLQYFSAEEIFVVVDQMKQQVEIPKYIQKIHWDSEFLKNNDLIDYNHFNKGIGWLAGDYFYYAFREKIDSEYYWLIEPDVAFTFEHLGDFFGLFESYDEDALLSNFGPRGVEEYWGKPPATLIWDNKAYGCSFPLVRLSGAAIDICKAERQKLSKLYMENNAFSFFNNPIGIHFPNDESLVATTLMREGFKVKSINDIFPEAFDYFNYHQWFSIPQKDFMQPLNSIIHPVRPISMFSEKLYNGIIDSLRKEDVLSYMVINPDNIENVASCVGVKVSNYIHSSLIKEYENFMVLDEFKKIIFSIASEYSDFRKKLWIWLNKTIVLDIYINDRNFTLDFELDNGEIKCYFFDRLVQVPPYLDKFKMEYPNLVLVSNKAKLFTYLITEKDILQNEIEKVIRDFYSIIKDEIDI